MRTLISALMAITAIFGVAAPANALPSTAESTPTWTERNGELRLINPFSVRGQLTAEHLFGGEYFDGEDLKINRFGGELEVMWDFAQAESLCKFQIGVYGGGWQQSSSSITIPTATLSQFPNSDSELNLDITQCWVGARVRAISTQNVVLPFLGRTPGRAHVDLGGAFMQRHWEQSEGMVRLDGSFEIAAMIPETLIGVGLRGSGWTGLENGSFGQNTGRAGVVVDFVPTQGVKLNLEIYGQVSELGDEFEENNTTYETVMYEQGFGVDLTLNLPYVTFSAGYKLVTDFRSRWGEVGANSSRGEESDKLHAIVVGLRARF